MRVKELIEKLQQHDGDTEVCIDSEAMLHHIVVYEDTCEDDQKRIIFEIDNCCKYDRRFKGHKI